MDETDSKSTKIDELLTYIEERLGELETEKEELREYQEKDKERRCLDYALKDADLQRIDSQIAELDQLQRSAISRDGDDKAEFEESEKEIEVVLFLNICWSLGLGDFVDWSETRYESKSCWSTDDI